MLVEKHKRGMVATGTRPPLWAIARFRVLVFVLQWPDAERPEYLPGAHIGVLAARDARFPHTDALGPIGDRARGWAVGGSYR